MGFAYRLTEQVNALLLNIKKNKVYSLDKSQVGINIGCEHNTSPKYVGVDGSFLIWSIKNMYIPVFFKKMIFSRTCTSRYHTFKKFNSKLNKITVVHHNLIYGLPFKNNSVKNIFSSHFLEHLTEEQSLRLLKECKRIMKKNGVLRIVVPSLDDEVLEMENIILQYKNDNKVGPLQRYLTMDDANRGSFAFHRKMYNFGELKKTLKLAGFNTVKKMKMGFGKIDGVSDLDVRDGLIVEAYNDA